MKILQILKKKAIEGAILLSVGIGTFSATSLIVHAAGAADYATNKRVLYLGTNLGTYNIQSYGIWDVADDCIYDARDIENLTAYNNAIWQKLETLRSDMDSLNALIGD